MRRLTLSTIALVAVTAWSAVHAQKPDLAKMAEVAAELSKTAEGIDWQAELPNVERTLTNIFEKYGWDSESDQATLEIAKEVSAVPPWQPLMRIDLLSRKIGERYGLTDEVANRLRTKLLVEVSGFIGKNAGTLMRHAAEAIETRRQGKPFTAQQVQRWLREGEQISDDSKAMGDRLIEELREIVPPAKLDLLNHDVHAYYRRNAQIDKMVERWRTGKWRPSEWGLQDDPIHVHAHVPRAGGRPVPSAEEADDSQTLGRWFSYDPETWIAYVVHIQRHFDLDQSQTTTARSIHAELVGRAHDRISSRQEAMKAIPKGERETHELYAPIRALFEELRERLDALPTSAQREAAES